MTESYLNLSRSVTLDANGNGTVALVPSNNEYWFPSFIRVSTIKQNPPFAYCAVYHLTSGVQTNPANFVDDTYLANSDTSSIISGTMVQQGEAIQAQFTGGHPGDTAVLTVFGQLSDTPFSVDVIDLTGPGTHFTGRLSVSADIPVTIDGTPVGGSPLSFPLNSDSFLPGQFTTYQTSRFNSWKLAELGTSSTNSTAYHGVEFQWFADAAGTNQIFSEYFVFSSNTTLDASNYGVGSVHGPYLRMRVHNYDTVTALALSFSLYGSQKIETRSQFHSEPNSGIESDGMGVDNILMIATGTVGAGANTTVGDCFFYNGPVIIKMKCTSTPTKANVLEFNFAAQPASVFAEAVHLDYYVPSTASNIMPIDPIAIFPRRVMKLVVSNSDTVANTFGVVVFAQEL